MKKILVSVLVLILTFGLVTAKGPKNKECTTIQSGELLASDGTVIETGYDVWGYNYQAHLFNGFYCDSYRDAAWCQPYVDVGLMMKWNDAWLSNTDCNEDGLLDRHFGYDSYIGSGAWLTNHQYGEYSDVVDRLDIGDVDDELGHNLMEWSAPVEWSSGYGGGDDGTFRLLVGPGDGCGDEHREAYFTMTSEDVLADTLYLRHLDGSAIDSFDLYKWNGTDWIILGSYEAQGGVETWVTTEFNFEPVMGEIQFKLVATSTIWSGCPTWGQVAFSYAELEATCYWDYFVKIVAVPVDSYVDGGTWYTADGVEIGPEIWGAFAIIQTIENDVCADVEGIQYNGPMPNGWGWYQP